MTDTTTGNQAAGGDVALPTQPASTATPQAISGLDAEALRKALGPLIDEAVSRRTQSDKDKRIGKLETEVKDFKSQLAHFNELKDKLGNEELAHLYMKMEDQGNAPMSEVNESGASQRKATQAGGTPETEKLMQALIGNLGLDANDTEVTEALRQKDDFAAQVAQMLMLTDKRKKAQDAATNPAQQMPSGGGGAIRNEDKEKIAAELLRLSQEPSRNYAKIQELNAKLKTIS